MAYREIELILTRQLASHLAVPTFLVDPEGTLLFYNEAAEQVLGRRFEETGVLAASEWIAIFHPVDANGRALKVEEVPLMISLAEGRPAYRGAFIRGLDGRQRQIEVTSVALIGKEGRLVGGLAFFWEVANQP